jgi:hypothetical protein
MNYAFGNHISSDLLPTVRKLGIFVSPQSHGPFFNDSILNHPVLPLGEQVFDLPIRTYFLDNMGNCDAFPKWHSYAHNQAISLTYPIISGIRAMRRRMPLVQIVTEQLVR